MKKAMVLLAPGFEEIEAATVIDILRRAGIDVTVAGVGAGEITGSRKVRILPDARAEELELTQYDACVLPGGMPGASNLAASDQVKRILLHLHRQEKLIGAICAAPAVVLAPLGILDGKAATCYPGMEEKFTETTTHQEQPVVRDGHLITSRGPGTALAFALTLVDALAGRETKEHIAEATLFGG
ncbi:MAG: DJ-1 family protein [Candidatus Omnitrophica bacterium]|nr:DJ-1 family protein [Candidatus Omnitrophota bacterium]